MRPSCFIMEIPILVRWHLYIETDPWKQSYLSETEWTFLMKPNELFITCERKRPNSFMSKKKPKKQIHFPWTKVFTSICPTTQNSRPANPIPVKLPWIFLGASLKVSGGSGNIQGNFDRYGTQHLHLWTRDVIIYFQDDSMAWKPFLHGWCYVPGERPVMGTFDIFFVVSFNKLPAVEQIVEFPVTRNAMIFMWCCCDICNKIDQTLLLITIGWPRALFT